MANNNSFEDKNVKMLLIVIVVGLVLYLLVGYFSGNGICGFRNKQEGFRDNYTDHTDSTANHGTPEPHDISDIADNAGDFNDTNVQNNDTYTYEDDAELPVTDESEGFQNSNSNNSNDSNNSNNSNNSNDGVQSSEGIGNNEDYGEVPQSNNKNELPNECYPKDVLSASDLLPGDANSKFAQTNPNGQGSLSDKNFLTAGFHVGTNTVGQSLRNANRQLRSDPPNPQVKVSPWMQTTIEPDVNRQGFEIGGN
jgi:hypothetical protein